MDVNGTSPDGTRTMGGPLEEQGVPILIILKFYYEIIEFMNLEFIYESIMK